MKREPHGIGIIGTGGIATGGHAPAIQETPDAMLVAALSRTEGSGAAFLEQHGEPDATPYTDLDAFVHDKRIDTVIVCSPDRLHYEHALAAIEAGNHVLLEKPMATDAEQAARLIEAASRKGVQLATGFHLRFHQGHLALRDRVRNGDLGSLRHVRAVWAFSSYDATNWRATSSLGKWWSLAAVGAHCIDLARWFADEFGDWVELDSVIDNATFGSAHDETAIVTGRLPNGVTIEVLSSIQFGTYHRVELFGDGGIAVCDSTLGRLGSGAISIGDEDLDFEVRSPFAAQLAGFLAAVDGRSPNRAGGDAGLRNVQDLLLALDT